MPTFKKHKGKIFGCSFTPMEQAIIEEEIEKQAAQRLKELVTAAEDNIDAQVLWYMHVRHGHGRKRLINDYYEFAQDIQGLIDYYSMEDKDAAFIADLKLKELGVDIQELKKGLIA